MARKCECIGLVWDLDMADWIEDRAHHIEHMMQSMDELHLERGSRWEIRQSLPYNLGADVQVGWVHDPDFSEDVMWGMAKPPYYVENMGYYVIKQGTVA